MATGLWWDLMDVPKFIRINNLKEVTSPIYLEKNNPTPDGVLSYEIFGITQEERKSRMAYVDLNTHYMNPLAALKLPSYDRKMNKILMSQGSWKLKNGEIVEDPDGNTGPEFLYTIWGKVKVRDKDTVTTKEIQKFFEQDKNILFLTKFPISPAYFRDLNTNTGNASKSSNQINSMYASLISYTQSMSMYTDTFTNITKITQARVQTILIDIYKELIVKTVKGTPSKFGMLRQFFQGKNINYSARLVISAPVMRKDSYQSMQTKYAYATIPLAFTCSSFFPFVVYELKRMFDSEFIQGGKYPTMGEDGKVKFVTITDMYTENDISNMILRYINSPSSRYDLITTPPDESGKTYNIMITGRFNKDNTTLKRKATLTDVLFIAASRATENKHVLVTRYPLESYNGQFPAKIEISSTIHTEPVTIGNIVYPHFPMIEGDPSNAFIDTLQFSNSYLQAIGGDYDGDTVSIKPVFTKKANKECEDRIHSNMYILNVEGKLQRPMEKDILLTGYCLSRIFDGNGQILHDINKKRPKYAV